MRGRGRTVRVHGDCRSARDWPNSLITSLKSGSGTNSYRGDDGVPWTWQIKNGVLASRGNVAQHGEMEAIATPEDVEAKVEVTLGIKRTLAQKAEGIAGELDRVECRQPMRDRESRHRPSRKPSWRECAFFPPERA